jgi:hypothetical protein
MCTGDGSQILRNPGYGFLLALRHLREETAEISGGFENYAAYREARYDPGASIGGVLRELSRKPCRAFLTLLRDMTPDTGPTIPEKSQGNFDEMVTCWLEWGREKGFLID